MVYSMSFSFLKIVGPHISFVNNSFFADIRNINSYSVP